MVKRKMKTDLTRIKTEVAEVAQPDLSHLQDNVTKGAAITTSKQFFSLWCCQELCLFNTKKGITWHKATKLLATGELVDGLISLSFTWRWRIALAADGQQDLFLLATFPLNVCIQLWASRTSSCWTHQARNMFRDDLSTSISTMQRLLTKSLWSDMYDSSSSGERSMSSKRATNASRANI